jgi:hypothetical protein
LQIAPNLCAEGSSQLARVRGGERQRDTTDDREAETRIRTTGCVSTKSVLRFGVLEQEQHRRCRRQNQQEIGSVGGSVF